MATVHVAIFINLFALGFTFASRSTIYAKIEASLLAFRDYISLTLSAQTHTLISSYITFTWVFGLSSSIAIFSGGKK